MPETQCVELTAGPMEGVAPHDPGVIGPGLSVSEKPVSRKLVNREGRSRALVLVPTRTNYLLTERISREIIQPREAFMYSH